MKKYIKYLLIISGIFYLDINVYGYTYYPPEPVCFTMPGKGNDVVVPEGYYAKCAYSFQPHLSGIVTDKTGYPLDSSKNKTNSTKVFLEFYKVKDENGNYLDQIFLSFGGESFANDLSTYDPIMVFQMGYPHNNGVSADIIDAEIINELADRNGQLGNFDGYNLKKGYPFSFSSGNGRGSIKFVGDFKGCPGSFYIIDRNPSDYRIEEDVFVFNGSTTPSITRANYVGAKINVYSLNFDYEDEERKVHTMLDLHGVGKEPKIDYLQYLFYGGTSFLDEALSTCSVVKEGNTNQGHNENISHEVIADNKSYTCEYYFEIPGVSNNSCYPENIKITYSIDTLTNKSTGKVDTTFSATSSFPLKLDNVTKEKISDYLIEKDGEYTCTNELYILANSNFGSILFGKSMYGGFSGEPGTIIKNLDKPTGTCISNNNGSGNNVGPGNGSTIDWGNNADVNCDGIIGQDMLDFLEKIFGWIQIIAPIVVIILSGVDFAGAVLQDDKDALKKASNKFIKRLIIAVALFFIPIILNFLLNVFNEVTNAGSSTCVGR